MTTATMVHDGPERRGRMSTKDLWVLDRIEDQDRAVLISEGGDIREVPLAALPGDVREGDALRESLQEGKARYAMDRAATAALKEKAEQLRSSLRRGPSGPISL